MAKCIICKWFVKDMPVNAGKRQVKGKWVDTDGDKAGGKNVTCACLKRPEWQKVFRSRMEGLGWDVSKSKWLVGQLAWDELPADDERVIEVWADFEPRQDEAGFWEAPAIRLNPEDFTRDTVIRDFAWQVWDETIARMPAMGLYTKRKVCPKCKGTGLHASGGDCYYCKGKGGFRDRVAGVMVSRKRDPWFLTTEDQVARETAEQFDDCRQFELATDEECEFELQKSADIGNMPLYPVSARRHLAQLECELAEIRAEHAIEAEEMAEIELEYAK